MVYLTGDCHADFDRFLMDTFPPQKCMTHGDTVIVLGDFGLWHDCERERKALKKLSEKPFTTCFLDGNHENFDRLYGDEFPIVDFHGGKAHEIIRHVYHLMRGYVYDFDGKKFFVLGGARSHDIQDGILDPEDYPDKTALNRAIEIYNRYHKNFRVKHLSWWDQELPSKEEMDFGLRTLEENGNKVDYILSHCCPQFVARAMGFRESDELTKYFNILAHDIEFRHWYFGHYHRNDTFLRKYTCLYEQFKRVV